ncbi:secondary thiamine-phosphate synthase enzyme YjbQ [Dehalococcoidales bacterium]|nr:secondary thiamine-phosphate synthase enzyme YjbQ [Dehalococcoidales bacterium]MCL0094805.1 secondary thiamine-phosphate synthase enzyme YjbQ [Dehalococcoidales bacterium]
MVVTKRISLQTKGECDIINITPQVEQQIAEAGINSGTATLFVTGSTAGISTIEFESGLLSDFQSMWERNVPKNIPYNHDRRWGEGNGYSHVRASLLGASLVIPFNDKRLTLGTWQQIVVVDFDNRPRSRQIILQIMGE